MFMDLLSLLGSTKKYLWQCRKESQSLPSAVSFRNNIHLSTVFAVVSGRRLAVPLKVSLLLLSHQIYWLQRQYKLCILFSYQWIALKDYSNRSLGHRDCGCLPWRPGLWLALFWVSLRQIFAPSNSYWLFAAC